MARSTQLYIASMLALTLVSAGCVSNSTFKRKADEAEHYAALSQSLEQDYTNLLEQQKRMAQRYDATASQLEDCSKTANHLRQDHIRARADIERLEKILADRKAEAGQAMAEMRRSIDRLEKEKRDLTARLEQEKTARQARIAELKSTYDDLVGNLETEIKRGEITISELQGRLTVNMVEKILFDSGAAEVKPAGLDILKRVGTILKDTTGKNIRVEGHTDNIPISPRLKSTYPSNWELSTARASSVVHFLQNRLGIPGERLSICGFGPYQPVASNTTVTGRAQNRRIQIVLVPEQNEAAKRP